MKVRFQHLPSLVRRYGVMKALSLYYRLRMGKSITIPGVNSRIQLRRDSSDIDAFFQIFINREYSKVGTEDAKYVIDGGANVGLFTLYMKSIFPDAKIYCLEPDPDNFRQLEKNTMGYSGIISINAGIWSRNTMLNLRHTDYGSWGVVVEEDVANGTVEAVSIGQLMKAYNIPYVDILKLDIEASEKEIFSKDYSCWLPKVKVLIVETHDFMTDGCGRVFLKAVLDTYKNFNYCVSGENTIIINNEFIQQNDTN